MNAQLESLKFDSAGLIPAIREGKLPGSTDWPLVIFTPGPRPTEADDGRV